MIPATAAPSAVSPPLGDAVRGNAVQPEAGEQQGETNPRKIALVEVD